MRMVDIIEKKRNDFELTKDEIKFMINGFTNKLTDEKVAKPTLIYTEIH